jgi:CDP-diacylglycerol--serine O-phosphatidyltransferase
MSDDGAIHNKEKKFPVRRLLPNFVTLISLCLGLTAVRFSLDARWEQAVTCVLIAAFIDGMDGRLARFLRSASNFGAQLDSFADFVSFGIAPSMILYLWKMKDFPIRGLGWSVAMFFSVCMSLRLARFNTALMEEEQEPTSSAAIDRFFVGVPAPAGGILSLIPMMITFHFGGNLANSISAVMMTVYTFIVAILLISRIPTFSGKKLSINQKFLSLLMVCGGILIASLIMDPWLTVPLIGLFYIVSIPFSIISYNRSRYI